MNGDPLVIIAKHSTAAPVAIYDIIDELGIRVVHLPLEEHISGWVECDQNHNYTIVVNSTKTQSRQRFTAAHELGHCIYHRDLIGIGTGDNLSYRKTNTPFPSSAIEITHERQASTFAANVLMPRHLLEQHHQLSVAQLSEKFLISEEALRVRLGIGT